MSAVVLDNIANHVLVCNAGTAGLLPDRLGITPCDAADDYAEADETSNSDVLDLKLKHTLRQKELRYINNSIDTDPYRDN